VRWTFLGRFRVKMGSKKGVLTLETDFLGALHTFFDFFGQSINHDWIANGDVAFSG